MAFSLTGFGTTESGVDRRVLRSFSVIATFVFIVSWLAVAISNFGSTRIIGVYVSTSEPAIFSRAKTGHQSGKGSHGSSFFLTEVKVEPLISNAMFKGREGFGVWTINDLVLFN